MQLSRLISGFVATAFVLGVAITADGHGSAKVLEVVSVTPTTIVKHGVEVSTSIQPTRATVNLVGPKLFSRAVQGLGEISKPKETYLGWYEIDSDDKSLKKSVRVLDALRGGSNIELTLSSAEYLLCPTQVITRGPPAEIPHGLDFYKAHRVVDGKELNVKLRIGRGDSSIECTVGKPVYVCIAANHWHHDDHTPASHPDQCFVVYEINEREETGAISSMDQFGLNQLKPDKVKMVCVLGKLLDPS